MVAVRAVLGKTIKDHRCHGRPCLRGAALRAVVERSQGIQDSFHGPVPISSHPNPFVVSESCDRAEHLITLVSVQVARDNNCESFNITISVGVADERKRDNRGMIARTLGVLSGACPLRASGASSPPIRLMRVLRTAVVSREANVSGRRRSPFKRKTTSWPKRLLEKVGEVVSSASAYPQKNPGPGRRSAWYAAKRSASRPDVGTRSSCVPSSLGRRQGWGGSSQMATLTREGGVAQVRYVGRQAIQGRAVLRGLDGIGNPSQMKTTNG